MAIQILPYAVDFYNSLPELYAANHQLQSIDASVLFTEIGRTFLNHQVENMLGLALLHNHFLLEPYEMLVNVDSVAVPWDIRSCCKELADVNASAWRFNEKGLTPYEFTYAAFKTPLEGSPMQAFLTDLFTILKKQNIVNLFGICSLRENSIDGPPTMEFTSGRTNITLPFDISPSDGNEVQAMWQFSSNPLKSSAHVGMMSQGEQYMIWCSW